MATLTKPVRKSPEEILSDYNRDHNLALTDRQLSYIKEMLHAYHNQFDDRGDYFWQQVGLVMSNTISDDETEGLINSLKNTWVVYER